MAYECNTCRFFRRDQRPEYSNYGHCKFLPPRNIATRNEQGILSWEIEPRPYISADDTCSGYTKSASSYPAP